MRTISVAPSLLVLRGGGGALCRPPHGEVSHGAKDWEAT
jgi:hypothetical protein